MKCINSGAQCPFSVEQPTFDCTKCVKAALELYARFERESIAGKLTEIGDLEHFGKPGMVIESTREDIKACGRNLFGQRVRVILDGESLAESVCHEQLAAGVRLDIAHGERLPNGERVK